jgi:hypothetical protein
VSERRSLSTSNPEPAHQEVQRFSAILADVGHADSIHLDVVLVHVVGDRSLRFAVRDHVREQRHGGRAKDFDSGGEQADLFGGMSSSGTL